MSRKKKRKCRRSDKEVRLFTGQLQQYIDAGGYTNEELADIFHMSKRQLIRWKVKLTRNIVPPKEHADSTLDPGKVGKINKHLNPIEFCDKYLAIKPNKIQRLIIKAFYGLTLEDSEREILEKWKREGKTTWDPSRKYKELVILAGMKGGKSTLASLFAQIEEYLLWKLGNPWKHYGLTPGDEIYITNVATDKDQARDTIFAKIKASIDRSPYFKQRNPRERGNMFKFEDTNVIMKSGHSNSSSLVGKANKLVELDELDRFKTRGGKYSADEVYKALNRNTDPFGVDGHIISISSLMKEKGKMVELYTKSKTIPTMLGFWLAEWEMMPDKYSGETFEFSNIKIPIEHKDEFDKDPEGFLRDKACAMGFTRGKFFRMPYKIDECFKLAHNEGFRNPLDEQDRFSIEIKGRDGVKYFMHGDASYNHCSYYICLGHREGENAVIDLLRGFKPTNQMGEIDVEMVKEFVLSVLDMFPNLELFTYDTWAAADLKQAIDKRGKKTDNLYVLKPQYEFLKEMIYANKLKCFFHTELMDELKALELIGDKVDHPVGGTKDCADTVAGVVWDCMMGDSGVVAAGVILSAEEEKNKKDNDSETVHINPNRNRRHIWDSAIH
jgi:hypothetical protein